jgi:hypothetical protein
MKLVMELNSGFNSDKHCCRATIYTLHSQIIFPHVLLNTVLKNVWN